MKVKEKCDGRLPERRAGTMSQVRYTKYNLAHLNIKERSPLQCVCVYNIFFITIVSRGYSVEEHYCVQLMLLGITLFLPRVP